jgi:hypothetical protein
MPVSTAKDQAQRGEAVFHLPRADGEPRRLALALIKPHAEHPQPVTLGADKGYDAGGFVMELRDKAVTPHVTQNANGRRSAIDGRTARHLPASS